MELQHRQKNTRRNILCRRKYKQNAFWYTRQWLSIGTKACHFPVLFPVNGYKAPLLHQFAPFSGNNKIRMPVVLFVERFLFLLTSARASLSLTFVLVFSLYDFSPANNHINQ